MPSSFSLSNFASFRVLLRFSSYFEASLAALVGMKGRLPFHEFHARSAFSFLRGASDPEILMARAAQIGLTTIAITDHEGFYGSARAYQEACKRGIRAITGATLEVDGAHVPVIWLVAANDSYFSPDFSKQMVSAFREGGDKVEPLLRRLAVKSSSDEKLGCSNGFWQLAKTAAAGGTP